MLTMESFRKFFPHKIQLLLGDDFSDLSSSKKRDV